MTTHTREYVVDANVLITAYQNYYAHDLLPRFWDVLPNESRVCSIDRVLRELRRGNDWLSSWAQQHRDWFLSTDEISVLERYRDVVNWVASVSRYKEENKMAFYEGADPWLVAYASVHHLTVVTLERPEPNSRKVKVPDVCNQFGVPVVNTFRMLRSLGIVF
ncbi:protein of unknown function [Alicyclobacillus macrosporangiidus]|uniref:PIN domain-containing protein n=1 Tax=Alicyclobacillus macrosporangiidus TaxID=392015 RepID=A0A1I7JHA0_9BACL|nr:protein of unknown function [Alicyclobacillus macrosporangiidus]